MSETKMTLVRCVSLVPSSRAMFVVGQLYRAQKYARRGVTAVWFGPGTHDSYPFYPEETKELFEVLP